MLIPMALFTLSLILLIKGGDWFVEGAVGIARRWRIPEMIIGATVVSLGTTLPELMVSATSAAAGHGEVAYGNAIGSIICNTALIAALTITIRPSQVDRRALKLLVGFFFTAAAFYCLVAYTRGYFSRGTGMALLLIFAGYLTVSIRRARRSPASADLHVPDPDATLEDELKLLLFGAALVAFGARVLVDNGTLLAQKLGVPESVISLTLVALGTSLPELVTAVTSLMKGHGALSLGNIVGANLLNLVFVSGVATVLSPFALPENDLASGANASLALDIPVMLLVMLVMTLPALRRGRLSRAQGVILLVIYAVFCLLQFASI